MMTDPIADMLTRIRNGLMARHDAVEVPASKMKLEIARILKAEGYIKNFKQVHDDKQGSIKVFLKYDDKRVPSIVEMKRVSKPGRRVYAAVDEIPVVKNGLGTAILSTSKGIMSDKAARKEKVGGEIICTVW
ncbi:MAG TPA: 30S ribosomal protein S8 [bacterium]|nr:30S ribosomal protein S8 [bacterium]